MALLKDSLITGDLRVTGTIFGDLKGNATSSNKANISTTTNAIAKYSDTIGTFSNSGVIIDANNNVTIPGTALRITSNAGLKRILLGNQDSSGANCPVILQAANGSFYIGNGNSWSASDGGTLSAALYMSKDRNIGINTVNPESKLHINDGVLKITANGNTMTIGSQNSSWGHFYNSSNIGFYFNRLISVEGDILPYGNTNTKNLGNTSQYFNTAYLTNIYGSNWYTHGIASRHVDAGLASSWNDSRLYIGYGAKAPTKSTGFYYSADTSSRTLFAEINSNGFYATPRLGINGQNTSYNLYVNGTSLLKGDIYYQGTKAITRMIRMVDNANDEYGNGISIGGGGLVIIGSGEYSDALLGAKTMSGGDETTFIGSDGATYIESNGQTIANRTGLLVDTGGHLIPVKAENGNNNAQNIGSATYKWANVYATTFHGALDGNASTATTATKATQDASGNTITSTYATKAQAVQVYNRSDIGTSPNFDNPGKNGFFEIRTSSETTGESGTKPFNSFAGCLTLKTPDNIAMLQLAGSNGTNFYIRGKQAANVTLASVPWKRIWCAGDAVTGAVWNDYAEYRESDINDAGYVLTEKGDDTLTKTTEKLQHFAGVSSDTWGFAQGETKKAKTPIAVAGRVLVYTYKDRNIYKPGDCVCAAPNGTVDIMTREEVIQWPDRIVGIVSSVPNYEEWGGGENADRKPVKVNGRIWIKIK